MRTFGRHISYLKKLALGLAIVFALLLQSIGQSVVIKCPGMMEAAQSSQQSSQMSMSEHSDHMNMDMGSENSQAEMVMDHGGATHSHICPPSGCDICTADDCSQCFPFQLNAISIKNTPSHKQEANIGHANFASIISSVALLEWHKPLTRAPPFNI